MSSMQAGEDRRGPRLVWGLQLRGQGARVATGVMFIAAGVMALLAQQGVIPHHFWRHGWPWIIVVISAVQVVTAATASRLADGVFFGLIGGWLVLVESNWHGLTYANSWPLTLVAVGASYVVKALASSFMPEGSRVRMMRMRIDDRDRPEGGGHA